mmetsp:Transcript_6012/g.12377  ORF Transcript_6012/g.12377 Transcript_6012/m.12377 type:complete len:225 (-) Transcript_6012:400-1074(-)
MSEMIDRLLLRTTKLDTGPLPIALGSRLDNHRIRLRLQKLRDGPIQLGPTNLPYAPQTRLLQKLLLRVLIPHVPILLGRRRQTRRQPQLLGQSIRQGVGAAPPAARNASHDLQSEGGRHAVDDGQDALDASFGVIFPVPISALFEFQFVSEAAAAVFGGGAFVSLVGGVAGVFGGPEGQDVVASFGDFLGDAAGGGYGIDEDDDGFVGGEGGLDGFAGDVVHFM